MIQAEIPSGIQIYIRKAKQYVATQIGQLQVRSVVAGTGLLLGVDLEHRTIHKHIFGQEDGPHTALDVGRTL